MTLVVVRRVHTVLEAHRDLVQLMVRVRVVTIATAQLTVRIPTAHVARVPASGGDRRVIVEAQRRASHVVGTAMRSGTVRALGVADLEATVPHDMNRRIETPDRRSVPTEIRHVVVRVLREVGRTFRGVATVLRRVVPVRTNDLRREINDLVVTLGPAPVHHVI